LRVSEREQLNFSKEIHEDLEFYTVLKIEAEYTGLNWFGERKGVNISRGFLLRIFQNG